MLFVNNNSKLSIIDNSGVSKFRVIGIARFLSGRIGNLCVGSLNRVKPRRRLKKGQIFRSLIVQSRFPSFRRYGAYIRSLATRSILVKRTELLPVANRLNSFYFLELRNFEAFKLSAITIYVILRMPFNCRNINSFSSYSCLENMCLRAGPTSSGLSRTYINSESVRIARTFKSENYFDFIRFFNLASFIFGYHKAFITRKSVAFFLTRIFRSKFLHLLLRNLFKFRKTSKGSFLVTSYFDNDTGFIRIREPHVAFSVTSPYFDYHSSKLNLNFTFNYKKNPQFLFKLVWMFGFLFFIYEISSIYF